MTRFALLWCVLAASPALAEIAAPPSAPGAAGPETSPPTDVAAVRALFRGRAPIAYRVAASHPHDPNAFTEGLLWSGGRLYESTGLQGESELREIDPASGAVVRSARVPNQAFAEGLTVAGGRLIQLTYKEGRAFVYDAATLERVGEFRYFGEGWGLAYDGRSLVMSDGSSTLTFRDPETFQVQRRVSVTVDGRPLADLNELEFFGGKIWANVWLTDLIVQIDPASGEVTGYLDLSGLMGPDFRPPSDDDVLNGIAYDPGSGRVFVAGKRWPRLFELELAR